MSGRPLRAALVGGLLLAGLGVQLHFFRAYPRPILFGDPAGYHRVGERFQEAAARLRAGEDPRAVFESVRGVLYLAGVGALFAVLDAWRPQDWGFFQRVLGLFNTAAMLGAFLLARRLSGRFAGGLAALGLCVLYPTFSVQTGRLYPDPVTGCLLVWAAWAYAEAIHRQATRWMAASALLLGAALLVRAQLVTYVALVLALALASTARAWAFRPHARRLALAFVLAFLPAVLAWAGIVRAVGQRDDVVQLGNATFQPLYPYGFWQFMETDGWIGPYRFKTEPYYRALLAEAEREPQLLRSRARQWLFTVRYVAARPRESVLLVLDNAYRLYDRPANDYKWDYPLPYPWQVTMQRAVMVLAVAGMALFTAARPALAGVFVMPLALAVLHGLVFPWPRYNVPVMPILLAAAGAATVRLWPWPGADRRGRRALVVLAAAAAALGSAALAQAALPEAARLLRWAGWLAVVAAPLLLVARAGPPPRSRRAALAGFLLLAVPFTAHALRDRRWHEQLTRIGAQGGEAAGVEQEILLGPEALGLLRAAAESFLVLDLRVPHGDLSRAELEVSGRRLPASGLLPTMPRLRESTATGGRDWRGYPQWWAVPLDTRWLPSGGEPLRIRLRNAGPRPLVLGADRFREQERVYEGPSFGDWPLTVALKLEYDGDYRIAVTRPLASLGTRSFLLDAEGRRRPFAGVHRIRLVTLRNNEGWLSWRSAPLPEGEAALAFSAWSGDRGRARLHAGRAPAWEMPLGARDRYELSLPGGFRLCHQPEMAPGDKAYGHYLLTGPPGAWGEAGLPVEMHLRFRTGMSLAPMYFVVDRNRPLAETRAGLGTCQPPDAPRLVAAVAEVLDATHNNYPEDTGRWAVDKVF